MRKLKPSERRYAPHKLAYASPEFCVKNQQAILRTQLIMSKQHYALWSELMPSPENIERKCRAVLRERKKMWKEMGI